MNKQQLANKIWESANKMRSKIEANEYKDFILGFIFYKFLSEKEEQFLLLEGMTAKDMQELHENDAETVEYIQNKLGYFIAYENLFSTWIARGKDFDISNVRDALSAFSRLINPTYKKVFEGIFDTLQTGLSKLGESAASQTKATRELIHLIREIPMDDRQDYDVLGFIYEYLIEKFAANAGKKAGEFYTPHEVSLLMSEIVADHLQSRDEIRIYDPTSGSGSLLINIGTAVSRRMGDHDRIIYYAQELKQNTYNLTRMNLVMRGIKPSNIFVRNGDTLEDDWPYFDESNPAGTYEPLYVDAVVSNPPYSQQWDPEGKETDKRFSKFGVAPKSKADYAFLLHDLFHLRSHGIMTIVLPHGVLFRGGEEGEIRKNLIERDHIAAIIGLPANIFFGTGIPTIIMVLRQKRTENEVLFIDASKGFVKEGKNNKLRASDIKRIVDVVNKRASVENFSRLVSKDEIRANEYNLNIPRYISSAEPAESWDLYASMFGGIPFTEIDELDSYWVAFPGLRERLFAAQNEHCAGLTISDPADVVRESESVIRFFEDYRQAFCSLKNDMVSALIGRWETIDALAEEGALTDNIFKRVSSFPLLDRYEAYQVLDDAWSEISGDLEMLQTEGFDAVRKVDPNMVTKKKKGEEEEVQEGWCGHIVPFLLVQERYFEDEVRALKVNKSRLAQISSEQQGLFEKLAEEDKTRASVNESQDGFVNVEVVKEAKAYKKEQANGEPFEEDSYEGIVLAYAQLIEEEKKLKKDIKSQNAQLEESTKVFIEELTDEQAYELMEAKWVLPVMDSLMELPAKKVDELIAKIKNLADKYQDTYADIAREITNTEHELDEMLGQLVGNEFDMAAISEFRTLLGGVA